MTNPITILGIGKSQGKKEIKSLDLDKKLNHEEGVTEKITKLEKRYFLDEDESASTLLYSAITEALSDAKLTINDIDCIINASATMQQAIPYNAAYTHKLLSPKKPIPSFDINMTCLSVLRAFDIASNLFNSYKKILIVSCDIPSVGLDWSDVRTAGIFADGASAMIVSSSCSGGIILSNFETHSIGYEYCRVRGGGHKINPNNYDGDYKKLCFFEMDGKKLYKVTSQILPSYIKNSLASKNLTLDDIDWIVPHQASQTALDHMIRILNIDKSKLIDIFKTHANQVASSIPSALYTLLHTKEVKSGQKIMLIGTSAGIGLGLVVWQVP